MHLHGLIYSGSNKNVESGTFVPFHYLALKKSHAYCAVTAVNSGMELGRSERRCNII